MLFSYAAICGLRTAKLQKNKQQKLNLKKLYITL